MFLGVITLLGVIVVPPYDIATGDMVYQKLCLGRMSIVFLVCSLISLYLNKKGSAFYSSIIWSFIILGGVEAVWGMEQIYGFVTSNHSLFTLTGSFYNPGPYSGYLAMVFPICLNEWLSLRKNQRHTLLEQGKYYLVLGVLLLILCVLPAGMSYYNIKYLVIWYTFFMGNSFKSYSKEKQEKIILDYYFWGDHIDYEWLCSFSFEGRFC